MSTPFLSRLKVHKKNQDVPLVARGLGAFHAPAFSQPPLLPLPSFHCFMAPASNFL